MFETFGERLDFGIASSGGQSGHVEQAADFRSATGDVSFAGEVSRLLVVGRQAGQGGDLVSIELSEFGQSGDEHGAGLRSDTGGINFSAFSAGFEGGGFQDFDTAGERVGFGFDDHIHGYIFRSVLGLAGSDFLVVPRTKQEGTWHDNTWQGAIFAGAPSAVVADNFTVFIDIDIFTEVEDGIGVIANGIEISGYLDEFVIDPFAFLDYAGIDPADIIEIELFGFAEDGDFDADIFAFIFAFQDQCVAGFQDEKGIFSLVFEFTIFDHKIGREVGFVLAKRGDALGQADQDKCDKGNRQANF